MEPFFDVSYPVVCPKWDKTSTTYDLFGAFSRLAPEIHKEANRVRLFPLLGQKSGLLPPTQVRARVPLSLIEKFGSLEKSKLNVGNSVFELQSPIVYNLMPCPVLISDIVTIKVAVKKDEENSKSRKPVCFREFVYEVGKFLNQMGIKSKFHVFPEKKIAIMKGIPINGYPIMVCHLSPDQSLLLQYNGLGGRGHIGCGIFRNPQSS